MLNDRKIRLMTQLAIYEKKEKNGDIKLGRYYKTDYVRLNVLKTGVAVTFAYLLILAMIAIYKSEYLIEKAVVLDYKAIGMTILGVYLALITVFLISALVGYSIKYKNSRKKLAKYFRMLKKLRHIYRVEDGIIIEDTEEAGLYKGDTVI